MRIATEYAIGHGAYAHIHDLLIIQDVDFLVVICVLNVCFFLFLFIVYFLIMSMNGYLCAVFTDLILPKLILESCLCNIVL